MQIQCKLRLTQLQREYLTARYEIRGKQRIHRKSLLTLVCSWLKPSVKPALKVTCPARIYLFPGGLPDLTLFCPAKGN